MDGVTCHFNQLHEVEAWQVATKSEDPAVVMFDLMLTKKDLDTLQAWGINPRREAWQNKQ